MVDLPEHPPPQGGNKDYTNLVALDAKVALIIDLFLRRGIRLFLPPSLAMRMSFISKDFAADRLPAAGIIALMLSDDKSEGYMTAKSDRAELDKALGNVKLSKDMSINHFKVLYQNALEDYNACSSIPKWVDTQEGKEEQIEFLLHLLGDGKLKEKMSTKFDKLRSTAISENTEHPGIDKFWELLTTVHAVLEHHKLRTVTTANPNKRLRDEQQVTTLNLDGGSQPPPCFNFQKANATAVRSANSRTPLSHQPRRSNLPYQTAKERADSKATASLCIKSTFL
jgi:hypothetical protein